MTSATDTPTTLDVLVLGGTSWLGGAVARRALDRGHRVTCLARGEAGTPPTGASWVRADRAASTSYDAVSNRDWDVVVDVSWQPDQVRGALAALAARVRHWVYVSSCSVYADDMRPGGDETAPLHAPYAGTGVVGWEVYGPAKVACEEACREAMGAEHTLLARAGLIAGDGDRSDRFGYWPGRVDRAADGQPVLVPPLDAPVQVIDVEDLAAWLVTAAELRTAGVLNAVGEVSCLATVLAASAEACGRTPALVEAADPWLASHGVVPWSGAGSLPLWLPRAEYAGFMTRRNDAALGAGLRLRPMAETVAAALRHEQRLGLDRKRRAGLDPGRERELLVSLSTNQ
ncbi:MAG: NAD-dependent epimerase/dehydratase family protein [Nocardioidaceae bacterium]